MTEVLTIAGPYHKLIRSPRNGEMIPPRPISWDCFSPLAGEAGRPRAFVFKNVGMVHSPFLTL